MARSVAAMLRSRSRRADGTIDFELARAARDAALTEAALDVDFAAMVEWLHRHDPAWRLAIEQAGRK